MPEFNLLTEIFCGIGTAKNTDLAMSYLSLPFFERKHQNRNEMVDGRQMGSAKVHPTAQIAQNVFIGENAIIEKEVTIYPGVVIMGHCKIGESTTIYPNVSINSDVTIGTHCRLHSNSVIGSDGFGYNFNNGTHVKVWHLGGVTIGDHVEIGGNCSIDRGTFKDTVIGEGTKLDNAIHIAHNCVIGKGVIFCAQSVLAGSVQVGNYALFGGRASVTPGVKVEDHTTVMAEGMVTRNWPSGSKLGGSPARAHHQWLKSVAALRKLSQ